MAAVKLVNQNVKYLRFLDLAVYIFNDPIWLESTTEFSTLFNYFISVLSTEGHFISDSEALLFTGYPGNLTSFISRWNKSYTNWGNK